MNQILSNKYYLIVGVLFVSIILYLSLRTEHFQSNTQIEVHPDIKLLNIASNLSEDPSEDLNLNNNNSEVSHGHDIHDMSKFVLKSSVEPRPKLPDMSRYISKTDVERVAEAAAVKACPVGKDYNPDDYIKKTEIPPPDAHCPKVPDLKDFVLKTTIPPAQKCAPCVCPKVKVSAGLCKTPGNNKLVCPPPKPCGSKECKNIIKCMPGTVPVPPPPKCPEVKPCPKPPTQICPPCVVPPPTKCPPPKPCPKPPPCPAPQRCSNEPKPCKYWGVKNDKLREKMDKYFSEGLSGDELFNKLIEDHDFNPLDGKYPAHWGRPPKNGTRDVVNLPGGYGNGGTTLAVWIRRNMIADGDLSVDPSPTENFDVNSPTTNSPAVINANSPNNNRNRSNNSGNNGGNNSGNNGGNNSGNNGGNNSGNNGGNNSGNNGGNNSGNNGGNNSGNNGGNNSGINGGNNSGNNRGNNSGNNRGNNSGNNRGNNSGNNGGNNSGNNRGNNSGNNGGNNSGNNGFNNSGNRGNNSGNNGFNNSGNRGNNSGNNGFNNSGNNRGNNSGNNGFNNSGNNRGNNSGNMNGNNSGNNGFNNSGNNRVNNSGNMNGNNSGNMNGNNSGNNRGNNSGNMNGNNSGNNRGNNSGNNRFNNSGNMNGNNNSSQNSFESSNQLVKSFSDKTLNISNNNIDTQLKYDVSRSISKEVLKNLPINKNLSRSQIKERVKENLNNMPEDVLINIALKHAKNNNNLEELKLAIKNKDNTQIKSFINQAINVEVEKTTTRIELKAYPNRQPETAVEQEILNEIVSEEMSEINNLGSNNININNTNLNNNILNNSNTRNNNNNNNKINMSNRFNNKLFSNGVNYYGVKKFSIDNLKRMVDNNTHQESNDSVYSENTYQEPINTVEPTMLKTPKCGAPMTLSTSYDDYGLLGSRFN